MTTEFRTWLRFDDQNSSDVFYLSDRFWIGSDGSNDIAVQGRLLSGLTYNDRANCRVWGSGPGSFGVGILRLSNHDGLLNDWEQRDFEFVQIHVGTESTDLDSTASLRRSLKVKQVRTLTNDVVTVEFQDPLAFLEKVISTGNYSSPPNTNIDETPYPLIVGKAFHCPPTLYDETNGALLYDVHAEHRDSGFGAINTVHEVRDRGAVLTEGGGSDYTTTNNGVDMNQDPDGEVRITASLLGTGLANILSDAITYTSIPFAWDPAIGDIDTAMGSPTWGYFFDPTNQTYWSDFIRDITGTCHAYLLTEADGDSNFKQLEGVAPSTTIINDAVIAGDIQRTPDLAPGLSLNCLARRNWGPITNIATSIDPETQDELKSEWMRSRRAGSTYNDGLFYWYEHAITAPGVPMFIEEGLDAKAEIQRVASLYGRPRFFYEVPVFITDDNYDTLTGLLIGDSVQLNSELQSNLGLEYGTDLLVIGRRGDFTSDQMTLILWGTEGRYRADSMTLDGTNEYYSTASAFTGLSDGKQGTFCIYFTPDDATPSAFQELFQGAGATVLIRLDTDGSLRIRLENSAGTALFDQNTTAGIVRDSGNALQVAWNLATGSQDVQVYLNDTDVSPAGAITDDSIDYTVGYGVGATQSGGNDYAGEIAHVGFDDQFIDFDTESNRRLFFDEYSFPVDGGDDGSTAFGSSPILWAPDGDCSNNRGIGGDMTSNGTPAAVDGGGTADRGVIF